MSTTCESRPEHAEPEARLNAIFETMEKTQENHLGYPPPEAFAAEALQRFFHRSMINLGNPFDDDDTPGNTLAEERELLAFFAKLTHLPSEQCRGYVTTGGSEGNLFGLFVARERLPGAPVYLSEATHPSVFKAIRCLAMETIPIACKENGTLDEKAFCEALAERADREAIVVSNAGTSMFGTTDDLSGIRAILAENGCRQSHIHVDAALSGMILPFCIDPPAWNFADGADTLSVSAHKMLGTPLPCGVVLTRKEHLEKVSDHEIPVTTIGGTRNALASLYLWFLVEHHGTHGLRNLVHRSMVLADYALNRLREWDLAPWRDPNATTVVFRDAGASAVKKWHLKTFRHWAQLVILPHMTMPKIDRFLDDLEQDLAKK